VELGNFILGIAAPDGTGQSASRRLLRELQGVETGFASRNVQDWGRKFLPTNGGCAYIDSDHLEIALPETFSAFDHVAYWRAMLTIVRRAMRHANDGLPEGCRLQVLVNCSDGQDNSYGSHVNVLLTRTAWDDIFHRRPHYLAYLAAFQVSSVIYTGQGKVGSERGQPQVDFQLSQRADFIETLVGLDTMVRRPIVNTRDEPLCGTTLLDATSGSSLARLHVIFFDSTLCQIATLLRVGTLQMIVAMLEAGCVNASLALDDPVVALGRWSRDPSLAAGARTTHGGMATALELQFRFLEDAERFAARGGFDGIVPDADRLLVLWEDTLVRLRAGDVDTLSRRLDWVLKRRLLQGVLDRRPELSWQSLEMKYLDQLFASLDETDGLFWACERRGQVDRVVDGAAVEQAVAEPPVDTRAWTRAHLLRRVPTYRIDHVDWDHVRVKRPGHHPWIPKTTVVPLPLPFGATRMTNEVHFASDNTVEELLDVLGAIEEEPLHFVGPVS
jgi:proteasome accessory factor A